MMELIEKEKDGIVWKYKNLTGQQVPDYKLNDPFQLFDLYCSQATEPPRKDNELTDALDKLYFRDKHIKDLEAEIQIVHTGTELLLKEGKDNDELIKSQAASIAQLEKELLKEKTFIAKELKDRKQQIEDIKKNGDQEKENLKKIFDIELKIQKELQDRLRNELE